MWSDYAAAAVEVARAASIEGDIGATVAAGRTAVERAPARGEADVAAFGCLGFALYLAGDTVAAESAATEAVQHPTSPQRPFALVIALGTLAFDRSTATVVQRADVRRARSRGGR